MKTCDLASVRHSSFFERRPSLAHRSFTDSLSEVRRNCVLSISTQFGVTRLNLVFVFWIVKVVVVLISNFHFVYKCGS